MSDASWPLDHGLYVASAADTVRRLRSHACIALWCGGNEQVPAPDLDAALRAMLPRRPSGDTATSGMQCFTKTCNPSAAQPSDEEGSTRTKFRTL